MDARKSLSSVCTPDAHGITRLTITDSLLDGWVTFTCQPSLVHVDIAGPLFLRLEIGEQLAWLASTCRKGMSPDQLTSISAIVLQPSSKRVTGSGTTVNIGFAFEGFAQDALSADDRCWLKLFRNCCIANGVSVNARQEEEKGLEIPFSLMATLGGFDRVAEYAGQLVLKGFETLFVPMKKGGGSIIWHLITKPNGRRISYNAMYTLPGQPEATVCMQDLYDSRHFLGWVSNASQHTGISTVFPAYRLLEADKYRQGPKTACMTWTTRSSWNHQGKVLY